MFWYKNQIFKIRPIHKIQFRIRQENALFSLKNFNILFYLVIIDLFLRVYPNCTSETAFHEWQWASGSHDMQRS